MVSALPPISHTMSFDGSKFKTLLKGKQNTTTNNITKKQDQRNINQLTGSERHFFIQMVPS
jgi:hypothetical protein